MKMTSAEDYVAHRIGPPPKALRRLSRNEELAVSYAAEVAWKAREEGVKYPNSESLTQLDKMTCHRMFQKTSNSSSPLVCSNIPLAVNKRSESSRSGTSFSSVLLNNPPPSPCSAIPRPTVRSTSGVSLPSNTSVRRSVLQPDRVQKLLDDHQLREREVSLPSEFCVDLNNEIEPSSRGGTAEPDCRLQHPLKNRLAESKAAILAALLSSPSNEKPAAGSNSARLETSQQKPTQKGQQSHESKTDVVNMKSSDSPMELERQLERSQQALNKTIQNKVTIPKAVNEKPQRRRQQSQRTPRSQLNKDFSKSSRSVSTRSKCTTTPNNKSKMDKKKSSNSTSNSYHTSSHEDGVPHISTPNSPFELERQLSKSRIALSRALNRNNDQDCSTDVQSRLSSSITTISLALSSIKGKSELTNLFRIPKSSASMLEEELQRTMKMETHTLPPPSPVPSRDSQPEADWEVATSWEEAKSLQQRGPSTTGRSKQQQHHNKLSSVDEAFDSEYTVRPKYSSTCRIDQSSVGYSRGNTAEVFRSRENTAADIRIPSRNTTESSDENIIGRVGVRDFHSNNNIQSGRHVGSTPANIRSSTSVSWGRSSAEFCSASSVSWGQPPEKRRAFNNLDVNQMVPISSKLSTCSQLVESSPASRVLEQKLAIAQQQLRSRTDSNEAPVTSWY